MVDPMGATPIAFDSDGTALVGTLHRPAPPPDQHGARTAHASAGPPVGVPCLVLSHGFPRGPGAAAICGRSYPDLAERLACETGWSVLTFNHRGTGESDGQFSLLGWLADLRAATDYALAEGASAVWAAGAGTGGTLALCDAAGDGRVRGVATLGAPADFDSWAEDPAAFLDQARSTGAISDADYPADFKAWADELSSVRPLAAAAAISPRPLLIVHGDADDRVATTDARALADTAGASAELRILGEAGHLLRHDPRAVAMLMGWMHRQWAQPEDQNR